MQTVLIADDEMAIAFLINKLIHWDELEMRSVGFALNGSEAYRLAVESRPDIIITDIQMPGMTGLELIRKLHAELPKTSFVIVSGYQEFEYAQQALHYGVEDYLLKPIKEKELNETLRRIRRKHAEDAAFCRERDIMQLEKQASRKRWLKRYMEEDGAAGPVLHEQGLFHFTSPQFLLFALCVDAPEGEQSAPEEMLERTEALFLENVRSHFSEVETVRLSHAMIGGLANLADGADVAGQEQHILQSVKEFLRQAQVKYGQYHYSALLTQPLGLSELSPRMAEVLKKTALMRAYLYPDGLFVLRETAESYAAKAFVLTHAQQIELLRLLDTGNEAQLIAWAEQLFERTRSAEEAPAWTLFSMQFSLAGGCREAMQELGMPRERVEDIVKAWYGGLSACASCANLQELMRRQLQALITVRDSCREQAEKHPIHLAKQFIYTNYSQPISIEEVAAAVHLSPAYFSALFKKSIGVNYLTFLTNVRMEKAKLFLGQTDMTMSEIAEKTGYGDVRYFSKVFTKTVGIRPAEYRRIHR